MASHSSHKAIRDTEMIKEGKVELSLNLTKYHAIIKIPYRNIYLYCNLTNKDCQWDSTGILSTMLNPEDTRMVHENVKLRKNKVVKEFMRLWNFKH
jgi:hypothetical protein